MQKKSCKKSGLLPLAPPYVLPIARVSKVFNRNLHHHQDPNFCVCHHYLQYCFNLFAERESFSNGLVECCVFSGSSVICFYFYSRKFLFLLSKILFFYFSFYSRSLRSEFQISLSTLEIRDQNLKFLLLLSKFEIRISNFSFYSRNSRSELQISLSTLEIRDQNLKFLFLLSNLLFLTLVNA